MLDTNHDEPMNETSNIVGIILATLEDLIAERKKIKRNIDARETSMAKARMDLALAKEEFNRLTTRIQQAASEELL